jgi:hypothetical protein
LAKKLATFMGNASNIYSRPVYRHGWTSAEAWNAVQWVAQQTTP